MMENALQTQYISKTFSQKVILILGILASLGLLGYALVNLVRMPAVSPDAFVPKDLGQVSRSPLGIILFISVLGFSFAFLPVSVLFTIKRYRDNPHVLVFGCSLLCLALVIEIFNNLPYFGNYVYPGSLAQIPPDVLLYLNQTAAIRYLSFDVAGFTLLYVSLFMITMVYWKSKRILAYLVIASIITFTASGPFLWIGGNIAVALMAISILCLTPIPLYFGIMAAE